MKDCANPRRISIRRMKKKKKKESFIHKSECITSNTWGCKFSVVSWLWLRSNSVRLIILLKALLSILVILFFLNINFLISIAGNDFTWTNEFSSNDTIFIDLFGHWEYWKWYVKFLLSQSMMSSDTKTLIFFFCTLLLLTFPFFFEQIYLFIYLFIVKYLLWM